jgi:hypothetical protein
MHIAYNVKHEGTIPSIVQIDADYLNSCSRLRILYRNN